MQSKRRRITALSVLVGSLAGLAIANPLASAAFGPATGTYQCRGSATYGPWSPVSAGPNTFIVGNCAPGTPIRRTYVSGEQNGPYSGGLIGGSFNGCGAVQDVNLGRRLNAAKTTVCTDGRHRNPAEFLSAIDCRTTDPNCRRWDPNLGGAVDTRVLRACQAYADVRPFGARTSPIDPVQVIAPTNRGAGQVRWRYITRDRRYVMVHDLRGRAVGGAIYVFVAAGCVSTPHAVSP